MGADLLNVSRLTSDLETRKGFLEDDLLIGLGRFESGSRIALELRPNMTCAFARTTRQGPSGEPVTRANHGTWSLDGDELTIMMEEAYGRRLDQPERVMGQLLEDRILIPLRGPSPVVIEFRKVAEE